MERNSSHRILRLAVAAGLGLSLALPLAAQDMTQGTRLGNRADKVSTTSKPAAASKAADQRFLAKATKANETEVAAATVGQQKAGAPDVRQYATHLLRDHQDMLVKLDETAVALGVSNDRRYVAMSGWGSGMAADPLGAQATTAAGATRTGDTVTGTGTTAGATTSASGSTGYESNTLASTDANAAATGMTTQAVPAAASEDPAVRKLAAQSGAAFDRAFVDHMVTDHKKAISDFERASKDMSLSPETRELATNALPKLRSHLEMAETLRVNLKTAQ